MAVITTPARGIRQVLYTLLLVAFLKSCTPWLNEPAMDVEAAEPPAISLRIDPKVQMVSYGGTGTVRVRITVPKNAQNRAVCVEVDGPTYRSSCFEHVGLGAPSQAEWLVKGLDAGEYVAAARLERSGGAVELARDSFVVSGVSEF